MNSTYPTRRRVAARPRRQSLAASVAALAAAMLTFGYSDLCAATGTWQPNPADQGVNIDISSDSSKWTLTKSVVGGDATLVEGDAVFIPVSSGGVNLGTGFSYYYVVGVGSTPSNVVRFSQSPSGIVTNLNPNTAAPNPMTVSKIASWFTPDNWSGAVIPNGIDDVANITTTANMNAVLLDRDVTLGGMVVDTTNCGAHAFDSLGAPLPGTNGLSLMTTSRSGTPLSTLTFKTSTGTPAITVSGGNSLIFADSKLSSNGGGGNVNAKLAILGNQGLTIDNQNPINTPIAVKSRTLETPTPSSVPTYGNGQVRFGFGLDWSQFSGDLTLAKGVFQTLAGGTLNNNLSSLPLNAKVILGTGTNTARLEITGGIGQTVIRGLESTSPNSSIINTLEASGTPGLSTLQIGSYGSASDNFTYAGNIGDTTNVATVVSSPSIRLVKAGPGTQTLSGVNNLNATAANSISVAVNGGKLSLGTTGAMGTITGGQGAMNADSSIIMKNGEFEISGLGVSGARSQGFGGQLIFGTLAPNSTSVDTNQTAQSTSFSTLTVVADPSQTATLTFGQLKPRTFGGSATPNTNGTTMLFRGTNLGATRGPGVATIDFTTAPTVGGGSLNGGTLGTTQAAVLKGALADTSPTGKGAGFATYDSVKGVRLLSSTEKLSVSSGSAYNAAPTTDNVVLNLGSDTSITGHLTNTLEIANTSLATRTLTNSGTDLNAANGFLFTGTDPIVVTGGQITGTVDSNAEDVIFHSINTSVEGVTIASPVSNISTSNLTRPGWVTYNGPGNFRVTGTQTVGFVGATTAASSFGGLSFNSTGTTTFAASVINASTFNVNQGTVKLDTGASWTNLPRLLMAPGATFDLNGIGSTATTNRFTDINSAVLAAGLSLNPISGVVTNSSPTTVDLILATATNGATNQAFFGTITGNLNLVIDKSTYNGTNTTYTNGVQAFSNANTYTGTTRIISGILNVAKGGSLPATTVVTLGPVADTGAASYPNSTLQLGDANGSTFGAVRQEIAGLYATGIGAGLGTATNGNGTSAVINSSAALSQLILNIPAGVENVYSGNLGITVPAAGSNSNVFSICKRGEGIFEANSTSTTSTQVIAYSGGTVIEGGILRISSDAKLGQIGSLSGAALSSGAPEAPMSAFPNQIILNGGTLQTTTTADFVLNAKRGIGLGPTSGSTGGTGTLWVDSGVNLSYSGIIASAGNTGTQTLIKNGTGTLSLFGTSTFTGTTQVSAGTLAGTGTLASGLTINSGGSVAPGNAGVGTLTFGGNLTLNSGGALNLELAAPGTSDSLVIGGTVSATGTTTVNISPLAGFADGSYTLITASAPINASSFATGTGLPVGKRGVFSSVGNTLVVTISNAPVLTALETWRQTNFGTSANTGNAADAADPDADGLPNLIEYATGTNPTAAGTSVITAGRNGNFLTLTYARIADTSLTYTVEGTSDFATWTTVSTTNNPSTGAQNIAGQVTVEDTTSIGTAPGRRFLRLKVSR